MFQNVRQHYALSRYVYPSTKLKNYVNPTNVSYHQMAFVIAAGNVYQEGEYKIIDTGCNKIRRNSDMITWFVVALLYRCLTVTKPNNNLCHLWIKKKRCKSSRDNNDCFCQKNILQQVVPTFCNLHKYSCTVTKMHYLYVIYVKTGFAAYVSHMRVHFTCDNTNYHVLITESFYYVTDCIWLLLNVCKIV